MKIFLSIIVPAYNEELRLEKSIAEDVAYFTAQKISYEIIVVNDGSTDGTLALATKLAAKYPDVQVVNLTQNRGKGGAIAAGVALAKGEYTLLVDADNATPISEYPKLAAVLSDNQADVAIGSRYLNRGQITQKQPALRRLISRTGNWFIQTILLSGIKDTQCGFKLFHTADAQAIFSRLTIFRFSYDIELLIIARSLKKRIREVPVEWADVANSTFRTGRDTWRFLLDTLKIKTRALKGLYR